MQPRAAALIAPLVAVGAVWALPAVAAPPPSSTPTTTPSASASAKSPSPGPIPSSSTTTVDITSSAEGGEVRPEARVGGGTGGGGFALNPQVRQATAEDVRFTYRLGCAIGPKDLSVVEVNHWDYSGDVQRGVLILRKDAVDRTLRALQIGADDQFPIFQMRNPDEFGGDDEVQMEANNTSAYNCRQVVGNPLAVSPHSYGRAVDFNPVQNPYKSSNKIWYPANGEQWIDRSLTDEGMLFKTTSLTRGMTRNGYAWGGTWANPDYQHFQM